MSFGKSLKSWLLPSAVAVSSHLAVAHIPLEPVAGAGSAPSTEKVSLAFSEAPEPAPSLERQAERSRQETPPEQRRKEPRPRKVIEPCQAPDESTLVRHTAEEHPAEPAALDATDEQSLAENEATEMPDAPKQHLADLTTTDARDQAGQAPGAPLVADATNMPNLKSYARELSEVIAAERRYPLMARRMGLEGTVVVRLKVLPSGKLHGRPTLDSSSGHEVLDREALRMTKAAAPFSAAPKSFDGEALELPVPIRFTLE